MKVNFLYLMTTTTRDYLIEQVRSGNVLIFSKLQTLNQGDTEYYFIENPEDNGLIEIESISTTAGTKTDVNIHTNVTVDTDGDDMHIINSRVGDVEDIGLTRTYGGAYSDLDAEPFEDIIPGGEGGSSGPAGNVVGGIGRDIALSIPAGENVLLEFVNSSSSDGYIAPRFLINVVE